MILQHRASPLILPSGGRLLLGLPSLLLLLALLASPSLLSQPFAAAQCNLPFGITDRDPIGGRTSFYDADLAGGIDNLVKITQVKVFRGHNDDFTGVYVGGMCTTYEKKSGGTQEVCNGRHEEEELLGVVEFQDGSFLKKIEFDFYYPRTGELIDWIRFTQTNGDVSSKLGYQFPTGGPKIEIFEEPDGVILAMKGTYDTSFTVGSGRRFNADKLLLQKLPFAQNQLLSVSLDKGTIIGTEVSSSAGEEEVMDVPTAALTCDNSNSATESLCTIATSTSTATSVSVTKTTSQEFSKEFTSEVTVGAEVGASAGFLGFGVSASASLEVSTGLALTSTFLNSEESSDTKEISEEISFSTEFMVPANTISTVELFVEKVQYSFDWKAPVVCRYSFDPDEVFKDDGFTGSLTGSQVLQQGIIRKTDGTPMPPTDPAPTNPAPTNPAPSPSPAPSCFSGDATVQVQGHEEPVPMMELQVGDFVMTGRGVFESVYAFGHRHNSKKGEHLQMHTSSSANLESAPLEISAHHILMAEGAGKAVYVQADAVKVGDHLRIQTNSEAFVTVTKVNSIQRSGLHAPLTPSGTIVVNGILASNYVSLQSNKCEQKGLYLPLQMQTFIAHLWMAPIRLVCMGASSAICQDSAGYHDAETGIHIAAKVGFQLVEWGEQQNIAVQVLVLSVVFAITGCAYVVEILFGATSGLLAVFALVVVAQKLKKSGDKNVKIIHW